MLPSGVSLAKETCKLWLLWFFSLFLLRNKWRHKHISGAAFFLSLFCPQGLLYAFSSSYKILRMPWDSVFSIQNHDSRVPLLYTNLQTGRRKEETGRENSFWGLSIWDLGSELFQECHWNLAYHPIIFRNISKSSTNQHKEKETISGNLRG